MKPFPMTGRQTLLITVCWFWSAEFLSSQSVERLPGAACFAAKGMIETVDTDGKKQSVTILAAGSQDTTISAAKPLMPSVQAGGTIRTDVSGETSLLLGTTGTVRVNGETEVRVPDNKTSTQSLELLKGRLFLKINASELKKRGGAEFKLKTPVALLAVKGTKFFANSKDGVDTVGVHEGAVLVTEPTSGKTMDVKAGTAVEIKAGEIGVRRRLRAAEESDSVEYAQAELRRIIPPIAVVDSEGSKTKSITTTVGFHPASLEAMSSTSPVITIAYNSYDEAGKVKYPDNPLYTLAPGGVLRCTTPRVLKKNAVYVAIMDLAEARAKPQSHYTMEHVAGVQLRYRAKNVAKATVRFWYDGTGPDCSAPQTITPSNDGKWEDLIVPIVYPGTSGSSYRRIMVIWKLSPDPSAIEQAMVLDVSDVNVFVAEK